MRVTQVNNEQAVAEYLLSWRSCSSAGAHSVEQLPGLFPCRCDMTGCLFPLCWWQGICWAGLKPSCRQPARPDFPGFRDTEYKICLQCGQWSSWPLKRTRLVLLFHSCKARSVFCKVITQQCWGVSFPNNLVAKLPVRMQWGFCCNFALSFSHFKSIPAYLLFSLWHWETCFFSSASVQNRSWKLVGWLSDF